MIIFFYCKSTKDFLNRVRRGITSYLKDMEKGAEECNFCVSDREKKSWEQNALALSELLNKSNLPDDVYVGFEYQVPVGGRIDCVLFGQDKNGQKNMVHIELKQWSNENVSTYYSGYSFEVVVEGYKSGTKITSHPSAQADEYQNHLLNYIAAFEEKNINLHGFAYCYNYEAGKDVNVLCNEDFEAVTSRCPLYCKDQTEAFAERLHSLLAGGNGEEVCQDILNSEVRPTKRLQDAAKNMFDGKCAKEEFSLVGNQLDAYNSILGAIKNTDKKDEKTVVIVKGGPGTGKSVIAMRLVSGLAKTGNYPNVYYSTKSGSLRNGYKTILKGTLYTDGEDCSSVDLIKNNIDFRPYMFKENEVDALIVDEAHRLSFKVDGANDQTDRDKIQKTYLSQMMSMLYTSRVSVFFIDDKQGIENSQSGTSAEIKEYALNYQSKLDAEKAEFIKDGLPKRIKIVDAKDKELAYAESVGNESEIEKILSAKPYLSAKGDLEERDGKPVYQHWLDAVCPTVNKISIIEIELEDQFRCNGSNNYLDWVDRVIYNEPDKQPVKFDRNKYEFEVFDTPQQLYKKVREMDDYASFSDKYKKDHQDEFSYFALKQHINKINPKFSRNARLIAGYCWPWDSKHIQDDGDLLHEVTIPEHNFAMPWETQKHPKNDFAYKYAINADNWANQNEGVNQIGCIYSMQGWETDYVGVIIGPDLKYDAEHDCLNSDNTVKTHSVSSKREIHDRLVKNIYRVLLTRGKKGCFVFACDPGVRDYLRRCMND